MYAVHKAAMQMPKAEYGVFTTLLQVMSLMSVPVLGLQTVFTQQAAAALHEDHERELAGIMRGVSCAVFSIWLAAAGIIFLVRQSVLSGLKIANPAALWLTLLIGLASMMLPIMMGVLQGRQEFLWFGGATILNGLGRFMAVWIAVAWLGGYAASGMAAVLVGLLAALTVCAWHNRRYWRLQPKRVDWSAWWRLVVPLTFGLGASLFMVNADMIFVQRFFSEKETGDYAAAGMIGRALVFFTQPLTAVLFPKVVRSAAVADQGGLIGRALAATAIAGCSAAVGCTLLPSLPLRLVYDKSFLAVAAPLVPWFAWCMLPLTICNVLITALLARRRWASIPWLAAVAAAYGMTLYYRHQTFLVVIQTLGVFSLLLLAVCIWFTLHATEPCFPPKSAC